MTLYVGDPAVKSRPVQWYLLIRDVERFNAQTKLGMGHLWGLIHDEDYDGAVEEFERIKERWSS